MPKLTVEVKGKIADSESGQIICDNSDYTIEFLFDEEWAAEPIKTARFIWNGQYEDIVFTGNSCKVPLVSNTNNLAVGVYAGDLRTTTPAMFACHKSILGGGETPSEPTEDVYAQIIANELCHICF